MFTNQRFPYVHQVPPENDTITVLYCLQCGVLIAEAVHKCRVITAPRLTQEDLRRLG